MTIFRLSFISVLLSLSFGANAAFIVDTGSGFEGITGGLNLDDSQFLAGRFSTTQPYVIESVEGWINLTSIGETGTVAIYTDGSGLPGTEIFSSAFTSINGDEAAWEGSSGLNWALPAGTYWASFEVRSGQTMTGAMSLFASEPLSAYSNFSVNDGIWSPSSFAQEVRINTVPIPAAVWLFGSALGLMGWMRRKQSV